jgi:hypothetical protein
MAGPLKPQLRSIQSTVLGKNKLMKWRLNIAATVGYFSVFLTWGIIFAFDYRRIGKRNFEDVNMSLVTHAGILVALAVAAWVVSRQFRTFIRSMAARAIIVVVTASTAVGLIRGNTFALIALDLKIVSWVFGGYALSCFMSYVKYPRILIGMIGVGVYFILIRSAGRADILDESGRIGRGVYWDYSELSLVVLGLLYLYLRPVTITGLLSFGAALLIHIYCVIILGQNRSDLLAFIMFGLCAFMAFGGRLKSAKNRRRGKQVIMWMTIFGLGACSAVFILAHRGFLEATKVPIIERMRGLGSDDFTARSRWDELAHFFGQSSSMDIIVGRGLGSTIRNVTDQQEMNYLHIAVFSFLMKLGLFPFLLITYLLYYRIPMDYIRAINGSRSVRKARRIAIMSSHPFFIGWLTLTLLSGGIDWYFGLGLGMTWAAYHAIIGDGAMHAKAGKCHERTSAGQFICTPSLAFYEKGSSDTGAGGALI